MLRSFAATGLAPEQGVLDKAATPFDARQVVAELAEGDFLCLDQAGRISAAYPFSATATPHAIRITGGASVRVRDVRHRCPGHAEHVNFFTTHAAAEAWASAHPEVTGGF